MDRWRAPLPRFWCRTARCMWAICGLRHSVRPRRALTTTWARVDKRPVHAVELMGLSETPEAGDVFYCVEDERLAAGASERRLKPATSPCLLVHDELDDLSPYGAGRVVDPHHLRADVRGSAEARSRRAEKPPTTRCASRRCKAAWAPSMKRYLLARRPTPCHRLQCAAGLQGFRRRRPEGVDVRTYDHLSATEDMEKAQKGLLKPRSADHHRPCEYAPYPHFQRGRCGGSYVTTARSPLKPGAPARTAWWSMKADRSLRRFKDDSARSEGRCGITLDATGHQEGDIIECFATEEIKDQ